MKYLVDTDVAADYMERRPYAVQTLTDLFNDGLGLSIVTYGELFEGVLRSRNLSRSQDTLERLVNSVDIVLLDVETMQIYGRLRGQLRSRGEHIGDADLMIAATAVHHDLIVVTRNVRHFSRVPGLVLFSFRQ